MERLNRDTVIAVVLFAVTGAFWYAAGNIEPANYETLQSDIWPRAILTVLFVLIGIYFFQSLGISVETRQAAGGGVLGWLSRYRNALWCYGLFLGFLMTLEWLGMLLGGILFVFLVLTVIGERTLRHLALHATIAVTTIAGMWSIFTFGLRVMLPEGQILSVW